MDKQQVSLEAEGGVVTIGLVTADDGKHEPDQVTLRVQADRDTGVPYVVVRVADLKRLLDAANKELPDLKMKF